MGKAFTEDQRALVQEKLRRAGLRLFAEKGIRGVSVRELTAEAGIAQGGFYSFYGDKDQFIMDLIELRITEKLADMAGHMEDSLSDPVGYVADMFYREGIHLKDNKAFDNMISGTLDFFIVRRGQMADRIAGLYRSFFVKLVEFWRGRGFDVHADTDGLVNMLCAAGLLFSNASLMDAAYFDRIYRTFCRSETEQFLRVSK